jgi:hypothetical protein
MQDCSKSVLHRFLDINSVIPQFPDFLGHSRVWWKHRVDRSWLDQTNTQNSRNFPAATKHFELLKQKNMTEYSWETPKNGEHKTFSTLSIPARFHWLRVSLTL